jgi:hypothetical protein
MLNVLLRGLLVFSLATSIAGCGGALRKYSESCTLSEATLRRNEIEVTTDATLTLPSGVVTVVKNGTWWMPIGSVDLGTVYRPVNGHFTFPGQWQNDAYLIISEAMLKGLYLPDGERCLELERPVIVSYKAAQKP